MPAGRCVTDPCGLVEGSVSLRTCSWPRSQLVSSTGGSGRGGEGCHDAYRAGVTYGPPVEGFSRGERVCRGGMEGKGV